ncbi:hypothetical protein [Phenylobacterium sp.]|uniref:hypothetical protein n=1 Tax=Phenylobacterium sp. TaxID=1871053 RepID=UPI002C497723|nr:hypothetical protein [Phenylobacterium sp.]HLZ73717.1 hypothetical protein [Phenylobacterium sp.]
MGKGLLERLGLRRKPPLALFEFRERVIEEVLRMRPDLEIERVGEAGMKTIGGGEGNVGRGYAYYLENPQQMDLVIRQLADLAVYEPAAATPESLIVLTRPESFQVGERGSDDRGLAHDIAAGLIAVVAVDQPAGFRMATACELRDELGMDEDAIWRRAFENLRARIDPVPPKMERGKVTTLKTGTGLAASVLAVEEFWRHPHFASEGDLVVCPIERDQVVVARFGDSELIQLLRRLAAGYRTSDFLCDRLLLRRNGAWEEFE